MGYHRNHVGKLARFRYLYSRYGHDVFLITLGLIMAVMVGVYLGHVFSAGPGSVTP